MGFYMTSEDLKDIKKNKILCDFLKQRN